jgi:phosphate transport system permease protein
MKNTKITSVNTAGMRRKREFKDRLANLTIGLGGVGVIAAICLIFFYLVFEVWPLFSGADLEKKAPVQTQAVALYLDADEYNESGIRVLADGQVQILDVKTGKIESATKLPLPEKVRIAHVQRGPILSGLVGIGLSNGQLLVAKPKYDISYGPNNSRIINTSLAFPYGETPLTVDRNGAPLQVFDVRGNDEDLRVTAFAAAYHYLSVMMTPITATLRKLSAKTCLMPAAMFNKLLSVKMAIGLMFSMMEIAQVCSMCEMSRFTRKKWH